MVKFVLALFTVCAGLSVDAQEKNLISFYRGAPNPISPYELENSYYWFDFDYATKNKVHFIRWVQFNPPAKNHPDGKSKLMLEAEYDTSGNYLYYRSYNNKKGWEQSTTEKDNLGRYIYGKSVNENGNLIYQWFNVYPDTGKSRTLISIDYSKRNYKEVSRRNAHYNSSNKLTRSWFYKKGMLSDSWEYTYYENSSRKSTVHYDRKGEPIHTWSFDCDEEGQRVEPEKGLTGICIKKETDDKGYVTYVMQQTDPDIGVTKTVYKFSADDKLVSMVKYNWKDIIIEKYELNVTMTSVEHIYYDQKGKFRSRYVTERDEVGKPVTVKEFDRKGNQFRTTKYDYYPWGGIAAASYFGSDNELFFTYKYEYVPFEQ